MEWLTAVLIGRYKRKNFLIINAYFALVICPSFAQQLQPNPPSSPASNQKSPAAAPAAATPNVPLNANKNGATGTTSTPPVSTSPPNKPKSDSSFDWSKITSALALIVSIAVAIYTYKKDRRARRHSIEDDYWLRKVISPIVIEPLLKTLLEMIAASPADCTSTTFSAEKTKAFHDDYVEKLSQLAENASALSLINLELASNTSGLLDNIQDIMIAYCFTNQSMITTEQGKAAADRSTFQSTARGELIKILQTIKAYQIKLS
jgi:hypothetical protein